jgi:hypothetical protein
MKAITVHVPESLYASFRKHAKKAGRPAAELIREALEEYRRARIDESTSLCEWKPASVGRVLRPLDRDDDLLGEMLEGTDRD